MIKQIKAEISKKQLASINAKLAKFDSDLPGFLADARELAFITSGGTKVPLEKNCVRFIDNFSTGTRGSLLCE